MRFFDEASDYWGNRMTKIIGAGDNRLSVRSVKIFADGKTLGSPSSVSSIIMIFRCSEVWWSRSR